MRARLSIASCALVVMVWAVPTAGTAHFLANQNASRPSGARPHPARFRVEKDRGLLLNVWLNGRGPFVLAVDTGAGINVLTERAAAEAQLPITRVRPTVMAGLSNSRVTSSRQTTISQMAIGDRGNNLPSRQTALVVPSLPAGIDGVLDPTQAYSPFGYSINMPAERIEPSEAGFDRSHSQPNDREGTQVSWLRLGTDHRPFVRLGDGRIALIDTGSGFGLAVNGRDAVVVGNRRSATATIGIRDIGGGQIDVRRVAPTTVSIGELELRSIPTDILYGIDNDVPVILGRDALYPFKITFDPSRKVIEFLVEPSGD